MKFKSKMITSATILLFIISLLLAIFFYIYSREVIIQNYANSTEETLQNSITDFESIMMDAYQVALYLTTDERLIQMATNYTGDEDEIREINSYIRTFGNNNVTGIYVYLQEYNDVIKSTTLDYIYNDISSENSTWISLVNTTSIYNNLTYIEDDFSVSDEEIFVYSFPLYGFDGEYLGEVCINISERNIFYACLDKYVNEVSLQIFDETTTISTKNTIRLGEVTDYMNQSGMTFARSSPFTGYTFVGNLSKDVYLDDVNSMLYDIITIILLVTLGGFFVSYIWGNRISKPVTEFSTAMEKVELGDLTIRLDNDSRDEIGELSRGFNQMLNTIENLIDEIISQQLLKREAEIEALQYQITPHFLYNTLNTIKFAAILQKSDKIAELLTAFTELLQMSTGRNGRFIPLDEEIMLLKNYVKLQEFRYPSEFSVKYDIDENLSKFFIPRLLLQPIVENSLLHGMKTGEKNYISVEVREDEDFIQIIVEDTGPGMSEQEVYLINEKMKSNKFSGIGITNIKERLDLYYENQAKIVFKSLPNVGTQCIIKLPKSQNPQEYSI